MKATIEVEIPKGCYCNQGDKECQFFRDDSDLIGVWDGCNLFHKCLDRVDKSFPTIKCQPCIHLTGTLAEIKKVHDYKRAELKDCRESREQYHKMMVEGLKRLNKVGVK